MLPPNIPLTEYYSSAFLSQPLILQPWCAQWFTGPQGSCFGQGWQALQGFTQALVRVILALSSM